MIRSVLGPAAALPVPMEDIPFPQPTAVLPAAHQAVPQAVPQPAPQAASVAAAADSMQVDDILHTLPPLYEVLWDKIGQFSARDDLLNLRRANKDISAWVDRSLTRLEVSADNAPAMLATIRQASNLKHIDALRVADCNNTNFPTMIAALAAVPHDKLHVEIIREGWHGFAFEEVNVAALRDIAPASLHLSGADTFSVATSRVLAGVNYPIQITADGFVIEDDTEVCALASIPRLTRLTLETGTFSDQAATAFERHAALTHLRLIGPHRLAISTLAVMALARNTTLRTLHIGDTMLALGRGAITMLAANNTLESLNLGQLNLTHFNRPFDASVAETLATNRSLTTLTLGLKAGCQYLARMPSLQHLTLGGSVSLEDARQFALAAHLKTLTFVQTVQFEEGALAILASSDIKQLTVAPADLTSPDIDALMANQALRSLTLNVPFDSAASAAQATRLAAHPWLETLTIHYRHTNGYGNQQPLNGGLTLAERGAMLAAWGPHRPASTLQVDL